MPESQECCPKFTRENWDKKVHEWTNKPFIRETMPTIFHMPLPWIFAKKITKVCRQAMDAKATLDNENFLMLFRDPTAFKSEIYLTVSTPVSGADNTTISGTFISMVFSGPYNAVPKFIKQTDEYLTTQNKKATDYYIHYAYCPKCAKKFGDNFMIIFAKV